MNKILADRLNQCNLSLEDILSKISNCNCKQTVFIYTSQLENLGTKDSDLDIYVLYNNISDDEFIGNGQRFKIQTVIMNGKMLDIEYWNIKLVYDLIDKLNSRNYNEVSLGELKLVHRLKVAEVVSQNELGKRIKTLIQNCYLDQIVTKKYLVMANSKLQDAIALYESQEYICALNCARTALENTIGALNAKNGFTNLKEKWIPKIFISNSGYSQELLNKYMEYQVYCNVNSSNIRDFVEGMFEFTQNVMSLVSL